MSIRVSPFKHVPQGALLRLERELIAYYSQSPSSYYLQADRAAENYTAKLQPFHCDLLKHVGKDHSVLELGCGTAHLCRPVEAAGGRYTGMDHGNDLLTRNRDLFPKARFFRLDAGLPETFDMVASLYTIEHVVDPLSYLEKAWRFCRAGGLLVFICPDFVDGAALPPSFYYGVTPRRLRAKLANFSVVDAARHLLDLYWTAPRWKQRARSAAPGAFWINLAPRLFAGADYSVDADAVHLPRLRDIVDWLTQRGSEIVTTSSSLVGVDKAVLRHNCYVLARKPLAATL